MLPPIAALLSRGGSFLSGFPGHRLSRVTHHAVLNCEESGFVAHKTTIPCSSGITLSMAVSSLELERATTPWAAALRPESCPAQAALAASRHTVIIKTRIPFTSVTAKAFQFSLVHFVVKFPGPVPQKVGEKTDWYHSYSLVFACRAWLTLSKVKKWQRFKRASAPSFLRSCA